jgi:serine/threonine-protein kinase RsbW
MSSDPTIPPEPEITASQRREAAVFIIASDDAFLERVHREVPDFPANLPRHRTLPDLIDAVRQLDHISLAFLLLVEPRGASLDAYALRELRLEFPQIVLLAILEECDQRDALRLQSIGVHSILLPPFDELSVKRELSTALPNVSRFKRHPDLMRRGQARIDFLIPSDLSYVLGVNYEVSLLLREFGFPPQDTRINIPLACDEAITNAIVHGNGSDPEKKVNIQVYVSHSRFRIRVRDQGAGFDPDAVEDPLEGENVLRPGGRGVFLMRRIMDTVEYREDGRVIELEKRNSNANGNNGA